MGPGGGFSPGSVCARLAAPCPLALLALLPACGGTNDLPVVHSRETLYSLLTRQAPEIVHQEASAPVRTALVTLSRELDPDMRSAPAVVIPGSGEVRYTLPDDLPPDATLKLALGLTAAAYTSDACTDVRLTVRLDEKLIHEGVLPTGRSAPTGERAWKHLEFGVAAGQNLVLATSLVDAAADTDGNPPPAAFGLLEVVTPVERRLVKSSAERPNLVIVLIDTTRADRFGCYGYDEPLSPTIDGLARDGAVFEKAYAPSSWTWPSTASILTGLSPPAHGVIDMASCFLAHDLVTIADRLREEGFVTAACSTNPLVSAQTNFDQGFDEFHEISMGDAWEAVSLVEPWLRSRGEERFFLYLHLIEPHRPYEPRPDIAGAWIPDQNPEGWSQEAVMDMLHAGFEGAEIDRELMESLRDHDSNLYDGEIATVDRAVHDLLELLRSLNHDENTIVVVTSDHGEEFLDHGAYGHGPQLFDETVRVPLIITGPGVAAQRVAEPVEARHLATTLFKLLGVSAGGFAEGTDFLDPEQRGASKGNPLFFSSERGSWAEDGRRLASKTTVHAVRLAGDLLVWLPDVPSEQGGEILRLFDLESDPGAKMNLAGSRPEQATSMKQMIERWLLRERELRPAAIHGGNQALNRLEAIGYVKGD